MLTYLSKPTHNIGEAMNLEEARQKIAYLEFVNDQVVAELRYIDKLLRRTGFVEGLKSLKEAAEEVLEEQLEFEEHPQKPGLEEESCEPPPFY